MRDGSQDLKDSSANIVPLEAFLAEAPEDFRRMVRQALAEEGFDLDDRLPNLQLAAHLLESLAALRRHGEAWDRFSSALRAADRRGVLVDLGSARR
jgi:hypothetical protein